MDVGPARLLRSPLVFQVGAEPHFPRLERFPTHDQYRERKINSLYLLRFPGWIWELSWQKEVNRRKAYKFYIIFLCAHESLHSIRGKTVPGVTSGVRPRFSNLDTWVWQRKSSEPRNSNGRRVYLLSPIGRKRWAAGLCGLRKQVAEAKEGPLDLRKKKEQRFTPWGNEKGERQRHSPEKERASAGSSILRGFIPS